MTAQKAKPAENPEELTNTIPVKYPKFLRAQITEMQERTGMKEQEIARLATWVGLCALAEIDYDLGLVLAKAGLPNWQHMRELRELPGSTERAPDAEITTDVSQRETSSEKKRKRA